MTTIHETCLSHGFETQLKVVLAESVCEGVMLADMLVYVMCKSSVEIQVVLFFFKDRSEASFSTNVRPALHYTKVFVITLWIFV